MPTPSDSKAIAGDIDLNKYISDQIARDATAKQAIAGDIDLNKYIDAQIARDMPTQQQSQTARKMQDSFRSLRAAKPGQEVKPAEAASSYEVHEPYVGPASTYYGDDTATAAGFNPNHDFLGSFRDLAAKTSEKRIAERAESYEVGHGADHHQR
jgi:hypothetical protein